MTNSQKPETYRTCDIMICAMARLIKENNTVFHGVSSHMPMLAVLLAKKLYAPHAVHLNIPGGVDPNPNNFVGAGIIDSGKQGGKIGILLRLEPNLEQNVSVFFVDFIYYTYLSFYI